MGEFQLGFNVLLPFCGAVADQITLELSRSSLSDADIVDF
jgi:hypothetical protein